MPKTVNGERPEQRDSHRPIRSYVRREGRITAAQRRALEELWPRYGVDYRRTPPDWGAVFGTDRPLVVEIGFGDGDALAEMAAAEPEASFLGVEVYRPGIGSLLLKLADRQLDNVRVVAEDATLVVWDMLAEASVSRMLFFFPDPWPKKRHHKRRLLKPGFLYTAVTRLVPGGQIHAATDWEDYALSILDLFDREPLLENTVAKDFAPRPDYRPLTKYEQRGRDRGHAVWDIVFKRRA